LVRDPARDRAGDGVALSRKPAHPHAAVLFYDFMLGEGRRSCSGELCADQSQSRFRNGKNAAEIRRSGRDAGRKREVEKLYAEIITRQSQ